MPLAFLMAKAGCIEMNQKPRSLEKHLSLFILMLGMTLFVYKSAHAEEILELKLENAAFPPTLAHRVHGTHGRVIQEDYPNAIAFIPTGIDASGGPIPFVFFFHGYNGCARSVAATRDSKCYEGGEEHNPLGLIEQFRASGIRAVLVIPEVRVEALDGEDFSGRFALAGMFDKFLREISSSPEFINRLGHFSMGPVVLASHSGGGQLIEDVLTKNDVNPIAILLFDSIYQGEHALLAWIQKNILKFSMSRPTHQILLVDSEQGNTRRRSHEFFEDVQELLLKNGITRLSPLFYERTTPEKNLLTSEMSHPFVRVNIPGYHHYSALFNFKSALKGLSL